MLGKFAHQQAPSWVLWVGLLLFGISWLLAGISELRFQKKLDDIEFGPDPDQPSTKSQ